ncbi:hypothetical protein DZC75_10755 [Pseudomonas parafulva]|uniref:Uncharacterized protein n=1 Tax=Pseudomonas parafulva TaxID=157782 RepID=A0AAI8PA21_9PSED|nr:hypothetical protein [Pseudomonas parafulva]AXO88453.1 hypothetical protein DZC75_10755 [Pseudomonas parafulva]
MAELYGIRTRDASGVVTLDTTVTPVRSLKMMQVTGNGAFDQYISIPEIQEQSFVVVDTLRDQGENTWSPQAWYSKGQLQLRQPGVSSWQVMILSLGGEPFTSQGDYGFRSRNGDIRTQIDSVNKVLSVRYSGSFQIGIYWRPGEKSQEIRWGDVNFPSPITTYERPLIFLNASDYMMVGNFFVKGSPGNWTGFMIRQHAHPQDHKAYDYMQIKWYCASYLPPVGSPGSYGLSIRDASGAMTFITTANLALLNSQPATNKFVSQGPPISGTVTGYAPSQQMPWTGNYGDFVLANALFSCVNIGATTQPIRPNFGGFLPGNRSILQMYCENNDGVNPVTANGRTLFASQPMKPI